MQLKEKIYKFLRWSQKYTKTDMIYVAKGGFWLSLGQATTFIASFLLTLAFANLVSKETFGTYKYVLSLAGILAIPTLSGMNTAILQAVSRGKEGSFIKTIKMKLKWGSLSTLASIILAFYYYFKGNLTLFFCFLIVSLFIPLINTFPLHESFWQGRKRFDIQNKYRAISQIAPSVLLVLTLLLTKNIYLIVLSYFFFFTLFHFILLKRTITKGKPNKEIDEKTMKYGRHLSLMNIIGTTDSYIDKIILWHYLGADALAVFAIAVTLPEAIKGILKIVSGLAMPKYARTEDSELKRTVPQKMLRIFFIVIPVVLIYILIAPFLFNLLFPKYTNAVIYSQVYILILAFFPRTLLGTSLYAKMKTKALYTCTIILPPIYIGLLLIFTPMYGIWGLILTFIILEAVTFLLHYILFKRM